MDYSKSVAQHLNNKRSSWANGAEGTLGSTGAYNPNSETANLYKAAEEDGGSRVMMVLVGVKSTVTTLQAALKSMKPWCVNMQLMALT